MDETLAILTQSKNEYSALLVSKLTNHVMEGIYSIFNEAVSLCEENDEHTKYLMTFQQFLARISRWNDDIIHKECDRIKKETNCPYLEDLLTCVHVAQTKILTAVRVGTKQKKIHTDIPSLASFIHKVYIETARNIYKNVFLFEKEINSLQKQKYRREIEHIIQYSILSVIRNTLPVEDIIRAYLDESIEYDNEEVIEEVIEEPIMKTQEELNQIVEDKVKNMKIQIEENAKREADMNRQREENASRNLETILTDKTHKLQELEMKANRIVGDETTTQPSQTQANQTQTQHQVEQSERLDRLRFSDTDHMKEYDTHDRSFEVNHQKPQEINAPKTIERLEQISEDAYRRRQEEEYDDDEEEEALHIGGAVDLDVMDLGIESL